MQTESVLSLSLDNLRASRAPLFHQYPRQTNPQSAFVELSETGEVSADWNGEIGNGVPAAVWHGCDLRFPVASSVAGPALADYLEGEEGRSLLSRIHQGHSVEWDGSNHVGRLDEDASAAREELEAALREVDQADVQPIPIWIGSLPWFDTWPEADNLRQAVEGLERVALQDGTTLNGDLEAYLLDQAMERHLREERLSPHQLEALQKAGKV